MGIRGVPHSIITDATTISGAQDTDAFIRALREHADDAARSPLDGAAICADGACEIRPR